jgi:DNA helicase-2/ATP-dependent DNA helicase PcrA
MNAIQRQPPPEEESLSLLDTLNPQQREAVTTTEGPLLVFAGAGSGKTRVLTYRIGHILEQGLATPNELLVVTFTNKAAGEVRERVAALVGPQRFPYLGTFHACCLRMLRTEHEIVGLPSAFSIYDTGDSNTVVKDAAKELGIAEEKLAPKRARTIISNAKNRLIDPETFERKEATTQELELAAKIYQVYERTLRENNALDFDDLLVRTVRLLEQHPDVLEKYQNRFKYILVDEYQDVNYAQYVLIQKLAAKHRNICVVGDDDQSIYGFRGADVSLILRFERDFPDARVVKLEQNYRSTQAVLDVANSVVCNNPNRSPKSMWTTNEKGELPRLYEASEGRAEARFVVRKIKDLVRNGDVEYGNIAVLYRTNAQSRTIEETLRGAGMPYVVVGGQRFWDRKEIRDLVAYLRVIVNPGDDLSLRRIINVPPRSLGTVTLTRLDQAAGKHGKTLFEVLSMAESIPDLGNKAIASVSELRKLFHDLAAKRDDMRVTEIIDKVIRTVDYKAFIAPDRTPESTSRLENLDELINTAAQFEKEAEATGEAATLDNFLNRVSLSSDVDDLDEKGGAISLLTLHAAKGLEYPVVFLVGMEEGFMPHARVFDFPQEIEEERRLAYVGLTRAQKQLYLSLARQRDVFGQEQPRLRSRFLDEIPPHMMEVEATDDRLYEDPPPRRFQYGSEAYGRPSTPPRSTSPLGGPPRGSSPVRTTTSARGGSSRTTTTRSSSRSSPVRTIRPHPAERLSTPVPEERTVHVSLFKVGDKVVHKVFGEGTVHKVDGKTVSAEFPGYGEKTVVESFLSRPR